MGRFLVDHEPCGEGFDVSHPGGAGSGVIRLSCRGCKETFEYASVTVEIEREVEIEAVPKGAAPTAITAAAALPLAAAVKNQAKGETGDENESSAAEGKSTAADTGKGKQEDAKGKAEAKPTGDKGAKGKRRTEKPAFPRPVRPNAARQRRKRAARRKRLAAGGVLALVLGALVFLGVRFLGESGGDGESAPVARQDPGEAQSPATLPTPAPDEIEVAGAETNSAQAQRQAQAREQAQARQQERAQARAVQARAAKRAAAAAAALSSPTPRAGEQLIETSRFSLVVPSGWARGEADGGLLLAAPGAAPVSVQVFYEENPSLSRPQMISMTQSFLESRSPGGQSGAARLLRVDGDPAFRLRKPGQDGSQTALGVLAGTTRLLAIAGKNEGAPASERVAAERALASLRPR